MKKQKGVFFIKHRVYLPKLSQKNKHALLFLARGVIVYFIGLLLSALCYLCARVTTQ